MITVFLLAYSMSVPGYMTNIKIIEPQPFASYQQCIDVLRQNPTPPTYLAAAGDADRLTCAEIRPGQSPEEAIKEMIQNAPPHGYVNR